MNKIIQIFILVVFLFANQLYSQFQLQWAKTYRGIKDGSNNQLLAMTIDNNSDIYITGMCDNPDTLLCGASNLGTNICTKKYRTSDGDTVWTQKILGCGQDNTRGNSIAFDANGFVFITGSYNSIPGNTSGADFITMKYNSSNGAPIQNFPVTYNGSGNNEDIATHVEVDGSGYSYVTGTSRDSSGGYHIITIKYNSTGTPQWTNIYPPQRSSTQYYAATLKLDLSGNVFVCGSSSNSIVILAYANSGGTLTGWPQTYSATNAVANDLALYENGSVYVTGSNNGIFTTLKYSHNGSFIWASDDNISGEGKSIGLYKRLIRGLRIPNTYTIDIFVTGYSGSNGTTIMYNETSNLNEWKANYSSSVFKSLTIDNSENVYVAGYTRISSHYNPELVAVYSNNGTLEWDTTYGIDFSARPSFIKLDGNGNIYIAGSDSYDTTQNPLVSEQWAILKIAPSGLNGPTQVKNLLNLLSNLPLSFNLNQNYPNPFNPSTRIKFDIPRASFTTLSVFDLAGNELKLLVNEELNPGSYEVNFDASKYSSGVYFYKLQSGDLSETKRMVVIK